MRHRLKRVEGRTVCAFILLQMLMPLLQGCSTAAQRLHGQALALGFKPVTLSDGKHHLASFFKDARPGQPHGTLHIYLEGDGRPWRSRTEVSSDPTPSNPLMLRLMKLDTAPTLYLARPCYNGHALDPGCHPLLWTHRRYGAEVVRAMAGGLRAFLAKNPYRGLVFLGHSGGGALAMLLASDFPQTLGVVTLAANLDLDAWADHHGYSRLAGSLAPGAVRLKGIAELHFFGANDEQVPAALMLPSLAGRPHARIRVLPDVSHQSGWEKQWPGILSTLPETLR